MRPVPGALLCGGLTALSVAADQPLVLAAASLGGLLLLLAAPGRHAAALWFAGVSALLVFLVNPWIGALGLTPLVSGPDLPLLDTELTVEELAYGVSAALRIAGSALAVAAFVELVDGDLLLAGVSRVAPRSAMIAALAARLLPTLRNDAEGLTLAARTRGARLTGRRPAAELLSPLLSLSLERSLALAEAMEARGYGSGPRSHAPPPQATAIERLLLTLGLCQALVAVWLLAGGEGGFSYYDLLDEPFTALAGLAATAALAPALGAALVVRWRR